MGRPAVGAVSCIARHSALTAGYGNHTVNAGRNARANYLATAILVTITLLVVFDRIGLWPSLRPVTSQLYVWGIVLAAVAIVVGALNVGWIHARRILTGETNWFYSAALIAALLAVLVGGLVNPAGIQSPLVDWIFQSIIYPGQATLFALLAFFMASAAFLYLRTGREGGAWILVGALLMLTAQAPVSSVWLPPSVAALVSWALDVPGMASLRGVLLGGSIATLVVGFRYLVSAR
jgi:hypothetical protein